MKDEDRLQAALWQYIQLTKHKDVLCFAVPNGGSRNVIEAVKLKRMGVTPGVSDLLLFHDNKSFALELKTEKGKVSEHQDEFLAAWRDTGDSFFAAVAHGFDNAVEILRAWGLIKGKNHDSIGGDATERRGL